MSMNKMISDNLCIYFPYPGAVQLSLLVLILTPWPTHWTDCWVCYERYGTVKVSSRNTHPRLPVFTESVCLLIFIGSNEEELDSDDLDDEDEDEEEEEEEEEKEEQSPGHAEMNGTEALDGLRSYMDQMDQELMSTNIGQSFNLTVNYEWDYNLCCTYLRVPPFVQPQPQDINLKIYIKHR